MTTDTCDWCHKPHNLREAIRYAGQAFCSVSCVEAAKAEDRKPTPPHLLPIGAGEDYEPRVRQYLPAGPCLEMPSEDFY